MFIPDDEVFDDKSSAGIVNVPGPDATISTPASTASGTPPPDASRVEMFGAAAAIKPSTAPPTFKKSLDEGAVALENIAVFDVLKTITGSTITSPTMEAPLAEVIAARDVPGA